MRLVDAVQAVRLRRAACFQFERIKKSAAGKVHLVRPAAGNGELQQEERFPDTDSKAR